GVHPAHGQGDRSEPASLKSADNGSAHSAHATGEGTSLPLAPANNGHHPVADPEINLASIVPNQPPEHPADNLAPTPAQLDDGPHPADPPVDLNELPSFKFANNGSGHVDTRPDGAHPSDPQVYRNQLKFADNGSGHPDTGPDGAHPADPQGDSFKLANNDPPALTAPSSGSSGTYDPAAPASAKPSDVPGTVMSAAPDQFVFEKNAGHGPAADHKSDITDIDQPVSADIQHVLNTAHETNAVSPPDPSPAHALQDMANAQAPHHQDAFHFA